MDCRHCDLIFKCTVLFCCGDFIYLFVYLSLLYVHVWEAFASLHFAWSCTDVLSVFHSLFLAHVFLTKPLAVASIICICIILSFHFYHSKQWKLTCPEGHSTKDILQHCFTDYYVHFEFYGRQNSQKHTVKNCKNTIKQHIILSNVRWRKIENANDGTEPCKEKWRKSKGETEKKA